MVDTREVTETYLFGTSGKPDNLIDENLIRPAGGQSKITVDINAYMAGPGRFANPTLFGQVDSFFKNSTDLVPGRYSETQIRDHYSGVSQAIIIQQEWGYSDGNDDHGERTYIWNTVSFEISDDAVFFVSENGDRSIENFAIIPYSNTTNGEPVHENFDLDSSDIVATIGNVYSELDPSNIGRTVLLFFGGNRTHTLYTSTKYDYDVSHRIDLDPNLLGVLPSEVHEIEDDLWDAGITRFLDEDDRPIIYGTNGSDTLDQSIASRSDHLSDYVSNGIVIVAGDGSDSLGGTAYSDKLYGGSGTDQITGGAGDDSLYGGNANGAIDTSSDELFGAAGRDMLDGGAGNDTLVGGADRDTLIGGDGDDALWGGSKGSPLKPAEGANWVDNQPDRLEGGSGFDTYYVAPPPHGEYPNNPRYIEDADGHVDPTIVNRIDIVEDSDGLGQIWFYATDFFNLYAPSVAVSSSLAG